MFDRAKHTIANVDPELFAAIQAENQRQEDHIELIASENYASPRVLEAQGSQLTNKYAEGYPGKRYYGGCEYVDVAERLAIDQINAAGGVLGRKIKIIQEDGASDWPTFAEKAKNSRRTPGRPSGVCSSESSQSMPASQSQPITEVA